MYTEAATYKLVLLQPRTHLYTLIELVVISTVHVILFLGFCFSQAFRGAGFTPHFVPVLHFEYTSSDQLAAALMDSKSYSGKLRSYRNHLRCFSNKGLNCSFPLNLNAPTHIMLYCNLWVFPYFCV